MRVLIAPQSFKGSLSATEVAEAIAAGLPAGTEADALPVADGGEGTVEAVLSAVGGERRVATVQGPLGQPVEAHWGLLADGRAVIEMAAASGLPLLSAGQLDPLKASTFGTGQLMAAALDAGATEVIVGIGGSATNDGGAGALAALGTRLLDANGRDVPAETGRLADVARVDLSGLHPGLAAVRLRVMCDVTNPLLGPKGATAVYGPQKGVTADTQPTLEAALAHWADVLEGTLSDAEPSPAAAGEGRVRAPAGSDVRASGAPKHLRDMPGAGAAGGLGFGLLALGGRLEPGADLILDLAKFDDRVRQSGLVITGEGSMDGQSVFGKSTVAVARWARKAGVPVLAIVGGLGQGYEDCYDEGVAAIMPITPGPMSLKEAQARAADLIRQATERAFRMIALGRDAARSRRQ